MKINNVGRAWRVGSRCVQATVLYLAVANTHAEDNWFGQRLLNALAEGLQTPAYTLPAPDSSLPQRRILPAPFDSPPFPTGDWQIGGTPIIGDPGVLPVYPLMEAVYAGPNGEAWKKSRIQICGWEDFSFNLSTSRNTSRGPNANFPLIYDLRPTGSSKTSSSSTSSACRTSSRPIKSIGASASPAFTASIIDS